MHTNLIMYYVIEKRIVLILSLNGLIKLLSSKKRCPIDRCGPRGPKQQRPRGSQPRCDLDAVPLWMKPAIKFPINYSWKRVTDILLQMKAVRWRHNKLFSSKKCQNSKLNDSWSNMSNFFTEILAKINPKSG